MIKGMMFPGEKPESTIIVVLDNIDARVLKLGMIDDGSIYLKLNSEKHR